MKDIGFQISQAVGESYFYLYYQLKSGHDGDLDVAQFMEFLKTYLEEDENKASAAVSLGQN